MTDATASQIDLSIVIPALNEERNIMEAMTACLQAFDEFQIRGEIIVVNDGSADATGKIVEELRAHEPRVKLVSHQQSRGIGTSFWDGVDAASGYAVVMLPGDNENDPREILQYYGILKHVDIVIPFVFNKEVRSLFRNALSFIYRFIVNSTFLVYFNYTNGTNLYRLSVLRALRYRSASYFFQTDILIRLVKEGYLFAEVPCRLGVREAGVSRASTFPSFLQVVRGYLRLIRDIYWNREHPLARKFTANSATKARRQLPLRKGRS